LLYRYIFLFLFTTVTLSSCKKEQKDALAEKFKEKATANIKLEIKDRDKIDSSTSQIYIDTADISSAHSQIISSISEMDKDMDMDMDKLILVELEFYQENFYLYDRCDGNIPMYIIGNDSIHYLGAQERQNISIIKKLKESDKTTFYLSENAEQQLIISDTDFLLIRKLKFTGTGDLKARYYTTLKNINKFDAIINNCPNQKESEFDGFTNPQKQTHE